MFQDYYRDRAPEQLGKEFGPQFALGRREAAAGLVAGTDRVRLRLASGVRRYRDPRSRAAFEEIEPDVKTAWLGEQKAQAWQKAYEEMRAKYTVLLPAPPDRESTHRAAHAVREQKFPTPSGEAGAAS